MYRKNVNERTKREMILGTNTLKKKHTICYATNKHNRAFTVNRRMQHYYTTKFIFIIVTCNIFICPVVKVFYVI